MTGGIEVRRHPRARRVALRLDPLSGTATLTLPPRASLRTALAWAEGKADWIAAQRARLPAARPFVDGCILPVADEMLTVRWNPAAARAVRRDGATLAVGGPPDALPRRIEAWLRGAALAWLREDTNHYAARAGVTVAGVAVGDPRGRWGSCASSGAIRYSWRLILAPGFVRRATAAHEVAHRVHMNHGAAFHALVAQLYGADPAPARAWLRTHGTALHGYGRSG